MGGFFSISQNDSFPKYLKIHFNYFPLVYFYVFIFTFIGEQRRIRKEDESVCTWICPYITIRCSGK